MTYRMKEETKEDVRRAILKFIPTILFIVIILLSFYIVALIIQDRITSLQAEILGYSSAGLIVFFSGVILFFKYLTEEQNRKLTMQHDIDSSKIDELEKELKRLQNDG